MKTFKISKTQYETLSEEDMIIRYTPLVKSTAYKWYEYYCRIAADHIQKLDREDFEQTGYMSVIHAYREYDSKYDVLFYTYLLKIIDSHMNRMIRDTLRIRHNDCNLLARKISSIDKTFNMKNNGDKDMSLADAIPDNRDYFEETENKILIEQLLSTISDMDKKIVIDYFMNDLTQRQIAIKYNTNQVFVSRALTRAMKLMNKSVRNTNKIDKGENIMARLDEQKLKNYLISNANKDITVSALIKKYCKKNVIPESTIFTALIKRMPDFYDEIKSKCKQNSNPGREKANSKINIKEAKAFISDKVEGGASISKAIFDYSGICRLSESTIRKYLLLDDPNFIEALKSKSTENVAKRYSNITETENLNSGHKLIEQSNNIMPIDIVKNNPFEEKGGKFPAPIINGDIHIKGTIVSDSLLKDLDDARVYFKGKNLEYVITNKGVMISVGDVPLFNEILDIKGIEETINELQKTIEITKTLF